MKREPSHRDYQCRALVLQGGGALGSYQAGVYEGLVEAGVVIDWIAGISIGALNAALIAGNAPEHRVARLHQFWNEICQQPVWPPLAGQVMQIDLDGLPPLLRQWMSRLQAGRAMFEGQRGFFLPRLAPWPLVPGAADATRASCYDTAPLAATLERFVDFDRINHPNAMRVSIGAVNVRNSELVYFDNRQRRLGVEHFMASAALPPAFPAVKVDGEHYWDGGIVMNTPLVQVLQAEKQLDTLVFQVDLWDAEGPLPTSLPEVEERRKDIVFSSRTRMVNGYMRDQQILLKCIGDLLELVPAARRQESVAQQARQLARDRRCNVIQLICTNGRFEGSAKDYEFGAASMRRHWRDGIADIADALTNRQWLAMPSEDEPFKVHAAKLAAAMGEPETQENAHG